MDTRKHCKSTSHYQWQPHTISMQSFCCPLPCRSLCKIVHSDLLCHHYKIQAAKKCQAMILLQEVRWIICYLNEKKSRCYSYLVKSYEPHFELSGCVNKTMWYWNKANPYELHLKSLHFKTVTIWCRIMGGGGSVSLVLILSRMKLVVPLLWHRTDMCIWWMISCFHTYATMTSNSPPSGPNKIEQQNIPLPSDTHLLEHIQTINNFPLWLYRLASLFTWSAGLQCFSWGYLKNENFWKK